jgi:hypothetical protein
MNSYKIEITEEERMLINFNLREEILEKKETLKYLKKDPAAVEEIKQIKSRIEQLELLTEKMYVAKAENYKDRLVQEKYLLKEKIDRLKDFLKTETAKKLKKEDLILLESQRDIMQEYINILNKRLAQVKKRG